MVEALLHTVIIIGSILGCFFSGYRIGLHNGLKRAEEAAERMRRIEPPRRAAGTPTNVEADPSSPRQPKWRAGQFKSGPPHPM